MIEYFRSKEVYKHLRIVVFRSLGLILLICCVACKKKPQQEEKFDSSKWAIVKEKSYPYRDKMLKDLIDNIELHGLKQDSILSLLGKPNRVDNGHLFYTVLQEFFPNTSWPIRTKTLVIKLAKDGTVEWRKIHE